MTRRDRLTRDMFAVPSPAAPLPGSMDYRNTVASIVSSMLDEAARAGKDRYLIAADCSRLAGKEVSKYTLDQYTAQSREDFNVPAWLMPVLEAACDSHAYSSWLAETRGGRLMIGRDALEAELGRITRMREELDDQVRVLKSQLRRGN